MVETDGSGPRGLRRRVAAAAVVVGLSCAGGFIFMREARLADEREAEAAVVATLAEYLEARRADAPADWSLERALDVQALLPPEESELIARRSAHAAAAFRTAQESLPPALAPTLCRAAAVDTLAPATLGLLDQTEVVDSVQPLRACAEALRRGGAPDDARLLAVETALGARGPLPEPPAMTPVPDAPAPLRSTTQALALRPDGLVVVHLLDDLEACPGSSGQPGCQRLGVVRVGWDSQAEVRVLENPPNLHTWIRFGADEAGRVAAIGSCMPAGSSRSPAELCVLRDDAAGARELETTPLAAHYPFIRPGRSEELPDSAPPLLREVAASLDAGAAFGPPAAPGEAVTRGDVQYAVGEQLNRAFLERRVNGGLHERALLRVGSSLARPSGLLVGASGEFAVLFRSGHRQLHVVLSQRGELPAVVARWDASTQP
jgi:hypothetical protein